LSLRLEARHWLERRLDVLAHMLALLQLVPVGDLAELVLAELQAVPSEKSQKLLDLAEEELPDFEQPPVEAAKIGCDTIAS